MLKYQSHCLCQACCGDWAPGSAVNLPLQSPTWAAKNTHNKYYRNRTQRKIYFNFLDDSRVWTETEEKTPFHEQNVFKPEVFFKVFFALLFSSLYKKDEAALLWFHVDLWWTVWVRVGHMGDMWSTLVCVTYWNSSSSSSSRTYWLCSSHSAISTGKYYEDKVWPCLPDLQHTQ